MKSFQEVTGKSVPDIIRTSARICAVELANRTQLFSVGKDGGKARLEKYKGYLKKDILKSVKDTDKLNEKAASIANVKMRERLQAAIASGKPRVIGAMLKAVGTIADANDFKQIRGTASIEQIHSNLRNRRTGRSLSTRPFYYYAKTGIPTYVNKISKRLGYTKSGWAECARKIGGTKGDGARGIPTWAKRHKGNNFKVKDRSTRGIFSPYISMTNTTPWVSRLLSKADEAEALDIGRHRMIKMMNAVFNYITKQRRADARAIKSITAEIVAQAE